MSTEDRLSAIQARLEAATPGPWRVNEPEYGWPVANVGNSAEDGKDYDVHGNGRAVRDGYGNCDAKTDAELIAHAPADLRFLTAALTECLRTLKWIEGLPFGDVRMTHDMINKTFAEIARLAGEGGG